MNHLNNKTRATIAKCGTSFTFKGGDHGVAILWYLFPRPLFGERRALGFAEAPYYSASAEPRHDCSVMTREQAVQMATEMGFEVSP